ncbi:disease resistance protein RUN1 [Cryptomeria japonica]|uniref:disease resistance protein RUN1 n=1 Tax=Cryptomeria japonica TaxID=3369 RepID=UPI0027DA146E|nr:disease resistance protein RUN1 [Cryptomeria japonica]XP_059065397.1 disease resistance protein RUN1 [Cryptomeria japonica]
MLLQPSIIERNEYCVGFLSPAQSKQLLCKTALGNADQSFPESFDIDGLVEKCGGIPLILDLIGSKLREHVEDTATCKELVTSLKKSLTEGEGEMCERVVDVVYNSFKESSQKEAFLDIVFFLNNLPWRIVSYVVGMDNLEALENAGLVHLCREDKLKRDTGVRPKWVELEKFVKDVDYQTGTVKVVDTVRARGRKLSNSDRILDDVNSISKAFECRQKLKGIWLSDKVKLNVESERFASTMSRSRILHFGQKVKVNGVCRENFESLRYLNGHDLPVDVKNAKKLAFLVGNVPYGVSQLPSSLRLLELRSNSGIRAGLLESVCNLSSLEELNLKFSSRRQLMLPATFTQLQCLRFLELKLNLATLPDSFGNLTALEGLSLKYCTKLQSLPESFCELKCLRFLRIEEGILTELPERFGNLSALEELHFSCCHLVNLPASFGKLESLRILGLYWCTTI